MIDEPRFPTRHATNLYVAVRAQDFDAAKRMVVKYGTLWRSDIEDGVAMMIVVFPGPERTPEEVGALLSNAIGKAYPFAVGQDSIRLCERFRTHAARWPE